MEKQKTSIFIALVLVLLIIAAVVAWITHDSSDEPEDSPSPLPTATSEVVVTTEEPTATPTPAPTATPTPTPTPTPAPTAPSGDGRVNQSGSFSSSTGTNLNILVNWKAVSLNDSTLALTVEVYVQSYSLDIGQRSGNSIYINSKGYSFVSSPVCHTNDNSLTRTLITSMTVEVPASAGSTVSIPVSVDWNYRGVYSGQEIEHITAETTLSITA